ncbi:hypothetical protein [Leptolyngbya sp. CCY15150]|uniref:NACHT and WD repeat domain-containing protein n=1 Tax=Leptolyngbya sp. CCY15150 TaxID=2767772 RepID=UPI0019519614|nr:hypothetical protein [Leptolyngbya sp. CCY15150]
MNQPISGDRNQLVNNPNNCVIVYVNHGSTDSGKLVLDFSQKVQELHQAVRPDPDHNPYVGLASFTEANYRQYFGRDRLVSLLSDQLLSFYKTTGQARFLCVYAPSGAGKSSLVRAGLIPELRQLRFQEHEGTVQVAVFTPGADPLQNLAHTLQVVAQGNRRMLKHLDELVAQLGQPKGDTYDCLQKVVNVLHPYLKAPLVLIIDQFEELYSLCKDRQQQTALVENLLYASQHPSRQLSVVVTLRSDFLKETQRHTDLNDLFSRQGMLVPMMNREELREAISFPAKDAGYALDESTVDRLLEQAIDREGALPLLQFALRKIWDYAARDVPPAQALTQLGGISGALAQTADDHFNALPSDTHRTVAKWVFLELVQLGEGSRDTRRRVQRDDLQKRHDSTVLDQVLQVFTRQRLITVWGNKKDATVQVELTHEALLEHWRLLQGWVDKHREDLRFLRQLDAAIKEWNDLQRPAGSLWRSPKLDLLKEFHDEKAELLSPQQQAFLQASVELEQAEQQAVLEREREKRRQRQRLTGVLSAGLVISSGFGGFSWLKTQEAQRSQEASEYQRALTLLESSNVLARDGQEFEALLTTMAAHAVTNSLPSYEMPASSLGNFYDSLHQDWRDFYDLDDHQNAVATLAFSPDGQTLATGSGDSTVKLWRVSDGALITSLDAHQDGVLTLAFSPDGQTLATGNVDSTVKLWRVNDGALITSLDDHQDQVWTIVFSPDGQTLASGSSDRTVKLWRVSDGQLITSLDDHQNEVRTIAFSPDGQTLVSGSFDRTVKLWRVSDGALITSLDDHQSAVLTLAFSPDGQTLASGSGDSTVKLWQVSDGQLITSLDDHQNEVWTIVFSPDGQTLASGGRDSTVKLWRVNDGTLIISLNDHQSEVFTIAFSPDGQTLATGSLDSSVKLYPLDINVWMQYACDWVGIDYIRNNPNMEGRRDICDGYEPDTTQSLADLSPLTAFIQAHFISTADRHQPNSSSLTPEPHQHWLISSDSLSGTYEVGLFGGNE